MKTEREKREYNDAVEIVRKSRNASHHHIMERLCVGYVTAATIIGYMESFGIVSKPDRSGKRVVLIE